MLDQRNDIQCDKKVTNIDTGDNNKNFKGQENGLKQTTCEITTNLQTKSQGSGDSTEDPGYEKMQVTKMVDMDGGVEKAVESPSLPLAQIIHTDNCMKPKLVRKINGGSFGAIYLAKDPVSNKELAVKIEHHTLNPSQVLFEGNIYRRLEGGPGIPKVYWFGLQRPEHNVLVMDLYGPNLYDLFVHCGRKFTLKTSLNLLFQILDILEFVHAKGYVHRDLKPDNFVVGRGSDAHKVYLLDFGLAKKYAIGPTYRRTNSYFRVKSPLVGTLRFASVFAHLGQEVSRRDDLESFAYMMVYFMKGSLPWQGLQVEDPVMKVQRIQEVKMETPVEKICDGLHEEMTMFLKYAKSMRVYDTPAYLQIKEMFKYLAAKEDIEIDEQYDWLPIAGPPGEKAIKHPIKHINVHPSEPANSSC